MGTKPKGMSEKKFVKIEHDRRVEGQEAKREKNAAESRERYRTQQAALGKTVKAREPMSEEIKDKIRVGVARAKANREGRKDRFGEFDEIPTGIIKRKYKKRLPIASLQMAGMVNDLERFMGNMGIMSATDYLEAREELIMSIIKRGGKLNGSI